MVRSSSVPCLRSATGTTPFSTAPLPASKSFVKAVFSYPFITLGYERLSTVLASSNVETMAFDLHIGFKEEARLIGAAHDGSDQVYLVMYKKDCKWLNLK
jgi:RimJ/RimL family protein N-acetyltransferase